MKIKSNRISDITSFGFKIDGEQYVLQTFDIRNDLPCRQCSISSNYRRRIKDEELNKDLIKLCDNTKLCAIIVINNKVTEQLQYVKERK